MNPGPPGALSIEQRARIVDENVEVGYVLICIFRQNPSICRPGTDSEVALGAGLVRGGEGLLPSLSTSRKFSQSPELQFLRIRDGGTHDLLSGSV